MSTKKKVPPKSKAIPRAKRPKKTELPNVGSTLIDLFNKNSEAIISLLGIIFIQSILPPSQKDHAAKSFLDLIKQKREEAEKKDWPEIVYDFEQGDWPDEIDG